jgi:hypothetical protein
MPTSQETDCPDVPRLLQREKLVQVVARLFDASLVQLESFVDDDDRLEGPCGDVGQRGMVSLGGGRDVETR